MERKHPSTYIMSSTKPTSASMSDLAPFVAAVLKDKTVMDLNKDIEELSEELREREEERLLVEITGRGGYPVHDQASLKDGVTDSYQFDLWKVYFEQMKNENGEDVGLPLNLIKDIEVRLGGIVVSDVKYLSNDVYYDGSDFSSIITGVEFKKHKIGSLLSIVERMGISTKTDSLVPIVWGLEIADGTNES